VEYLLVGGDEGGEPGGLAVNGIEDGQLGGLGKIPAGMGGGGGIEGRMGACEAEVGRAGGAADGGGRRDTKDFVRDSWEEKMRPLWRTYTVLPSRKWTVPRIHPWRSR